MSCKPTYKGKRYNSIEELKSSINNVQQEQIKKFKELQERLNNKEFLEGAKNAFESSEELQQAAYEALGFKQDSEIEIVQQEGQLNQRWGNTNYFKEDMSDAWAKSSLRDSVKDVNVNDIITYEKPTEEQLAKFGEYKTPEYTEYSTGFPIAIKLGERIILLDGHRRLETAKRKGEKTIKVAIKDVTAKYKIITPQQKQQALDLYTDYIARVSVGILPNQHGEYHNSQVKDIVYHGTDNINFKEFYQNLRSGIHFGTTKQAEGRRKATDFEFKNNTKLIPVILNITNPLISKDYDWEKAGDAFLMWQPGDDLSDVDFTEYLLKSKIANEKDIQNSKGDFDIIYKKGYDGIIYKNEGAGEQTGENSFAVSNPEQIHILGSKQDIKEFKQFVSNNQERQLYSQYLESLNKPNTNPILQDNQQEQLKKFVELQERLNNKEFLEGAKNAYESSKELQQFGTQEQYNDYIARVSLGILPNQYGKYHSSKVKDIVYHGTPFEGKFDKEIRRTGTKKGIFFSASKDLANQYTNGIKVVKFIFDVNNQPKQTNSNQFSSGLNIAKQYNIEIPNGAIGAIYENYKSNNIISAIINLRNPNIVDNNKKGLPFPEITDRLFTDKNDGIIINNTYDNFSETSELLTSVYGVDNKQQIHILGSKQDVEGFKEFVDNNQERQYQKPGLPPKQQLQERIEEINFPKALEEDKQFLPKEEKNIIQEYLNTPTSTQKEEKPSIKRDAAINSLVDRLYKLTNILGVKIKDVDFIYNEQLKINDVNAKLQDVFLSNKERVELEKELEDLKSKGVDKQALASADIFNRIIQIVNKDDVSKLAEEVVHYLVEIIEQKDPNLFKSLKDKAWNYPEYEQVKKDYEGRQGEENLEIYVRKEVIAKVVTNYLVGEKTIDEKKDEKTESIWQSIISYIKNMFSASPADFNSFKSFADRIMNSDIITPEDIQYLNKKGLYYSRVSKSKLSAEELRDDFLNTKSKVELKEYEGSQRYFYEGKLVAKRVSDIVSNYYKKIFRNPDRKDFALSEVVREEGIDLHKIFQISFQKYVTDKGEVRENPIEVDFEDLKDNYSEVIKQVDEIVQTIIKQFPNHYFLTEVPIISNRNDNKPKLGGTIDLLMINKENGEVSIYDWKTKRGRWWDKTTKKLENRTKTPWWNINGWRIQLREYANILTNSYGVTSFGQIRMIPVMTFEKRIEEEVVYKNAQGKQVIKTEVKYNIEKIEVAPFEKEKIDAKRKQLLPVVSELEVSKLKTIQEITTKIRAIIDKNIAKMSKDFKLKESLEEQNIVLESLHTILMVTTSTQEAIKDIQSLLYESQKFLKNYSEEDLSQMSYEQVFDLYKEVKNFDISLSVYENISNITNDFFGKSASNIIQRYKDVQKEADSEKKMEYLKNFKEQYEAAKELVIITQKIKDVRTALKNKEREYMELTSNKLGVPDLFTAEVEDGWIGGLLNSIKGIYSLNFKTAKLASRILLKAQAIIQDKNKVSFNKMEQIRSNFIKDKSTLNLEKLFEKILKYDPVINDYFLIPKIDKNFYREFNEMRDKFQKGFDSMNQNFLKTKEYKEIKNWIESNINVEKFQKNLEERRNKSIQRVKEANKVLEQEDPIEFEILISNKIATFNFFNDIFNSPEAWEKFNKSLYINETKWISSEYKKLNKEEKEAYEHFRNIYRKAEELGYVHGFNNLNRVPFKLRTSQSLLEGINPVKAFIHKEDDEIIHQFTRVDPITGEEIREIPIYMTDYLPAKRENLKKLTDSELKRYENLRQKDSLTDSEERELYKLAEKSKGKRVKDIDLFQVYLEFEYNLNRFEELSKVEDILMTTVEIEEMKSQEYVLPTLGNESKKLINKQKVKELMSSSKESILRRAILSNLYKINSEKSSYPSYAQNKYFSPRKIFKVVNDYTSLLFISGNLKVTGGAMIGSSAIALTGSSKNFDSKKYLAGLFKSLSNRVNVNKHADLFNYRISQKEVAELDLKRTELHKKLLVNGKKALIDHLSMVDEFVQDAVFYSTLDKFAVIDNKIVNLYDHINTLIPTNITYQQQKDKEKELYKKFKSQSLQEYLNKNNDISKLDKSSVYDFESIVRLESKKIIGNMTYEDSYALRWGIIGAMLSKFKTWFPELANTFFGGVHYREEGKRFESGRFRSMWNTFVVADEEGAKMGTWILNQISSIVTSSLQIYNIRNSPTTIKNLELRYLQYVKDLENEGLTDIPTKKEYIDLMLQEARNGTNFLLTLPIVYTMGIIFSILAGDDPDKDPSIIEYFLRDVINLEDLTPDSPYGRAFFSALKMFTHKGLQELLTFSSTEGLLATATKLSVPQLGALTVFVRGYIYAPINTFIMPILGEGENQLKYTIEATPILRPFMRSLVSYTKDTEFGEELQEVLNVDPKFRKRPK